VRAATEAQMCMVAGRTARLVALYITQVIRVAHQTIERNTEHQGPIRNTSEIRSLRIYSLYKEVPQVYPHRSPYAEGSEHEWEIPTG
jgi:hypothetical protein